MTRIVSNVETPLLIGLINGEHKCFKKLFDLYSKPLYRFSFAYLKSEQAAEDVVQEVFMKIWKRRKDIDPGKSFYSYLFTIALNSIRKQFNELAEENRLKHDILESVYDSDTNIDDNDNYQELLGRLELLINKLPARRREIFLKKKIECKSLKEIAQECNISPKTVEDHITESMNFLRDELKKSGVKGMVFFLMCVYGIYSLYS